jgi:hypothetical protein
MYTTGFPVWVPIMGLVVSVACSIGSYFIAKKSGRSGAGYAVLGFFLGIIGLIITLIICRNPAAPPYPQQYQQQQPYYPPQQPPYPPQQQPYQPPVQPQQQPYQPPVQPPPGPPGNQPPQQ